MSWGNYELKCPECDGYGEVVCSECDSEHECDACNGTGLDFEKVDIEAFQEATKKAFAGTTASWELIEDDVWVGREGDNGAKVYYRDFLRKT
jgi:RecJ-like exonuclease